MSARVVTNVVVAGLGGQGVLKASDILADAAFRAGFDVKKAEVHGMSQRGGSVSCDVRYGARVWSPMVPVGEADFLLILEPTQVEPNRFRLRADGVLLDAATLLAGVKLPSAKSLNAAGVGLLSAFLDLSATQWQAALEAAFPAKFHASNAQAFEAGRQAAVTLRSAGARG